MLIELDNTRAYRPVFDYLTDALGTRCRWRNPDRERLGLDDEPLIPMIHTGFPRFSSESAHIQPNVPVVPHISPSMRVRPRIPTTSRASRFTGANFR